MSRRLDWDRAKVRLGARIHEVTDEVPTAVGPLEAGQRYLSAAIEAVLKGRSLPKPSAVFLRYFKAQFPHGSVEGWLQKQPQYLAALKRREAKEAAAAQRAAKPNPQPKPTPTPTPTPTPEQAKRSKPKKTPKPASPADMTQEQLRKLILRRRKEKGPRPPPLIEKRNLSPRKP